VALEPIRGVQPQYVDLMPQKYLSLFGVGGLAGVSGAWPDL
jgi:hypothetical protein